MGCCQTTTGPSQNDKNNKNRPFSDIQFQKRSSGTGAGTDDSSADHSGVGHNPRKLTVSQTIQGSESSQSVGFGGANKGSDNNDSIREDGSEFSRSRQKGNLNASRDTSYNNSKTDKNALNQSTASKKKKKVKQQEFFYISPKIPQDQSQDGSGPQQKIYHVTNQFPIQPPYSQSNDWKKLLTKFTLGPQATRGPVTEQELAQKILELPNRNWISEQIKLHHEIQNQQTGSLDTLVTTRKFLQLREDFNQFLWAIAQHYFMQKQNQSQTTQQPNFISSINSKIGLPKLSQLHWTKGFEYKGIFITVLPYEDAYYIRNEIQALKYVQTELQELKALKLQIQNQMQMDPHLTTQKTNNSNFKDIGQPGGLLDSVMLPLIAGYSCCGFYMYATPIIYIQDFEEGDEIGLPHQRSSIAYLQRNGSIFKSNFHEVPNSMSYSYLQQNISDEHQKDKLFQTMPILKNITKKNLIPIIDFEQFQQSDGYSGGQSTELCYLLTNLFDCIPALSETSASTILMNIPCEISEDIQFHTFPFNNLIEAKDLKQFFKQSGNSMRPQGDKDENESDDEDDDSNKSIVEQLDQKKFSKHGWDFVLISKKSNKIPNRRSSNFYTQQEVNLTSENINQTSPLINPTMENNSLQQNQYHGFQSKVKNSQKSQKSYLDTKSTSMTSQHQQQSPFLAKQTILKRTDSTVQTPQELMIHGNTLIAAYNRKKEFKLKYSMISHNYGTNIEQLFSNCVQQVVQIIENSDTVFNTKVLGELLHRKGLNIRFEWLLLCKLKNTFHRDIVKIDIIVRVMRKVINEEIKIKLRQIKEVGNSVGEMRKEIFYSGSNALETYKETVVFFSNAILKRKFCKYKQVFDETLLGLFLSRISIFGIVHALDLKKEELQFLQSKELLEEIIEAPSINPVLFINTIQTYFNIDLSSEFLRICRQDKFLLLSKPQTMTVQDIKKLKLKNDVYFTLKEFAYFELARQITNSKNSQQANKINSSMYSNKDQIRSIFKRKEGNHTNMTQQNTSGNYMEFKYPGHSNNMMESQRDGMMDSNVCLRDSMPNLSEYGQNQVTNRNKSQNQGSNFVDQHQKSTIRQYQNISQHKNTSNNPFAQAYQDGMMRSQASVKGLNMDQLNRDSSVFDFSKLGKRNNFQPSKMGEIILPSNLYKLNELIKCQNFNNIDADNIDENIEDLSPTFQRGKKQKSLNSGVKNIKTIFQQFYEMPNLDIINEWVMHMESILKDIYSIHGSEQVLLECYIYQGLQTFFFENDLESLFKILFKISHTINKTQHCAPEIVVMVQILQGFFHENYEQGSMIDAERSYLTSLVCLFHNYGDPRGRGNFGIPYKLMLSWKLSLLALIEDKKLHDAEYAEEIFDATMVTLLNHKQVYKANQENFFWASVKKDQMERGSNLSKKSSNKEKPRKSVITKFEQNQNLVEIQRTQFDISKFVLSRQQHSLNSSSSTNNLISHGGGFMKQNLHSSNLQNSPLPHQSSSIIKSSNSKPVLIPQTMQTHLHPGTNQPGSFAKYNSEVPGAKMLGMQGNGNVQGNVSAGISSKVKEPRDEDQTVDDHLQRQNLHQDLQFIQEDEYLTKICPFQHWSIYRNLISNLIGMHVSAKNRKSAETSQQMKQLYKSILKESLQNQMDEFYQWVMRYNPIMYMSGVQWTNQMMKEIVSQDHIVSSSGSSIVNKSIENFSNNQSIYSIPQSAKEKKFYLTTYSQILGKECGGVQKQDMSGVLFTWGSDQFGQLGQNTINEITGQISSLKIMYPRMLVQLKDQMIKEITCGYNHTLAITFNGHVFSWGNNEHGQLGLGPDVPDMVKRPILNPYLSNITKLSAGNEHSVALTKNLDVYIWGSSSQTGLHDVTTRHTPSKMEFFQDKKVKDIFCGGLHTIALTQKGKVYVWGSTEGSQLGLPQDQVQRLSKNEEQAVKSPQLLRSLENVSIVQIACGETHTIAMSSDGKLYGWGMSMYGQLGLGFSADSFEPGIGMEKSKVHTPTEIVWKSSFQNDKPPVIKKIFCGSTFSLFITTDGELYGCGMNDLGQLGVDTQMEDYQMQMMDRQKRGQYQQLSSDVTVPTKVICFQGISINTVTCGENHVLAINGDDRNMLWSWGQFKNGQLGQGEVSMKMNPRPVQSLCSSHINRISCGSTHSSALIGDSTNISTFSSNYYINNDILTNTWATDIKSMNHQKNVDYDDVFL